MGSGPAPRGRRGPLKDRGHLVTSDGRPIVDCDVNATLAADPVADVRSPAAGNLALIGGQVVVTHMGTSQAVLRGGELTERLTQCLKRGKRYEARVRIEDEQVVVDVRPAGD